MALNDVMALILRYFTEFGSFRGALRKSVRARCRRKNTFAVSSPDKFLVEICERTDRHTDTLIAVLRTFTGNAVLMTIVPIEKNIRERYT